MYIHTTYSGAYIGVSRKAALLTRGFPLLGGPKTASYYDPRYRDSQEGVPRITLIVGTPHNSECTDCGLFGTLGPGRSGRGLRYAQRLQCSSCLVMTYFLFRDYNILPKKELRWSLWVFQASVKL